MARRVATFRRAARKGTRRVARVARRAARSVRQRAARVVTRYRTRRAPLRVQRRRSRRAGASNRGVLYMVAGAAGGYIAGRGLSLAMATMSAPDWLPAWAMRWAGTILGAVLTAWGWFRSSKAMRPLVTSLGVGLLASPSGVRMALSSTSAGKAGLPAPGGSAASTMSVRAPRRLTELPAPSVAPSGARSTAAALKVLDFTP